MRSASGFNREQVGWYFYDWANSAFSTTVVTVFLGPYLTTITKAAADADGLVHPFGLRVTAGSFFPYVVSLSALFVMMRTAKVADKVFTRNAVITVIAMGYSVFAIYASGKDAVLGGMLVLGITYIVWGFIAPRFATAPATTATRAAKA